MYLWEGGLLSINDFLKEVHYRRGSFNIVINNKKEEYYNIASAFDIETSSFMDRDNKRAIMYCWQFGIDNLVTLGRTWEEYFSMMDILSRILSLDENRRLVVYVHNLAYEFQWIRKRVKWEKVFILSRLRPVYAITSGIEFRCSWKLSRKSLKAVADDLNIPGMKKMVGDLDYSKIRTPLTPLTDKELRYCEYDIRVIEAYITNRIEQDGDITKIPLTSTGYVRNYCRRECFKRWKRYHNFISSLTIEPDEFSQLQRAFQGGFTHANAHYVRKTLNNVASADITSSYPTVMLLEKFPMSKAKLVTDQLNQEQFQYLLLNKCCLFDVEITNMIPKLFHEHPLSASKCSNIKSYIKKDHKRPDNVIVDNGRVVMADRIVTTLTEQDYFILTRFYKWDSIRVYNLRCYEKEYLPKQLVMAILKLYVDKTKLKDVEGEELNYQIAKEWVNACYGMIVTNPVRDILEYADDEFKSPVKPNLDEAIETYNNNIKRFLFYPWGVWVTAYARANLFSCIAELANDYVYSDTDSNKYLNYENHLDYFTMYEKRIREKIHKAASYHHIDEDLFSPKTIYGKVKTIGLWDSEGVYKRFKTLGAKRYLIEKEVKEKFEDNGLQVELTRLGIFATIAGANKTKTASYLALTGKPFETFDHEFIIPPEWSGRVTFTYIDFETEGDVVDYLGIPYHYHEMSSVHMENSEYSLSIHDEFMRYLEGLVELDE